jgi:hypothetical protein
MSRRIPNDLVVVMALALLAMFIERVWAGQNLPATLGGLLLVFVLPGYAVMSAALPQPGIGRAERLLLTFGISLVLAIVAGLALNWTPWGLRTQPLALTLGAVTVGASIVGLIRRPGAEAGSFWRQLTAGLRARQIVLFGVAVGILGLALTIGFTAAGQRPYGPFTQLWALPAGQPGKPAVQLGIRNDEGKDMQYRLQLLADGQVVQEWEASIPDGQAWETVQPLPPALTSRPTPATLDALLYRQDAPSAIYREVRLSNQTPAG